jgi:phosphate transport system substrate-binding protein
MSPRLVAPIIAAILIAACSRSNEPGSDGTSSGAAGLQVNGTGATFPYPIYSKWFAEYNRLHPDIRINYQSLGSGAGIRQLTRRTVFFGASDQPMDEAEIKAAPGRVLHFPTVLGAVVPVYNLPGLSGDVKFTGSIIADIVLGKIRKWNDPALAAHNPGVTLPDMDITLVHRSDGSGTTFIFADYLGKVSPEFKSTVGVAASLKWPTGVGAKGNEGVSGLVRQAPGAIGYVELVYALQTRMAYGAIQNSAGEFVKASLETVTAAAETVEVPSDFRISITNSPGRNAYPIASFTWLLLYEDSPEKEKSRIMVDFLRWAITDGQKFAAELGYAPLPKNVADMELTALEQIRVQ